MSTKQDLKTEIANAITAFAKGDLSQNALHLLNTLGYRSPNKTNA